MFFNLIQVMQKSISVSLFMLLVVSLFAQQDTTSAPQEEVRQTELLLVDDYDNMRASMELLPEIEFAFPVGFFRNKYDGVPMGKGIGIYYRLKKYPVNIGLRFGDVLMDKMKRSIQDTLNGDNFPTDLREIVKSRAWFWYGAVRFEPVLPLPVQPYFEGTLGPQRFFTRRRLREAGITISTDEDDPVVPDDLSREALHSDWGWAFSGAVGVKISLYRNYMNSLDLQLGYRQGTTAVFHVKTGNSAGVADPLDNFELRRSPVSMLFFKIGFAILAF